MNFIPDIRSFLAALAVIVSSMWIFSCSSSTRTEYDYQASAHIEPNAQFTTTAKHELQLELYIQTPTRQCWEFDKAFHGLDSDAVTRKHFTYVMASIKKPSKSVCGSGLDTVVTTITIPFDTSGVFEVRYPQVDRFGVLKNKSVLYTIP